MPTPFESGRRRQRWFTSGRGRGHAMPNLTMMAELARLPLEIEVRFVLYGTGAVWAADRRHYGMRWVLIERQELTTVSFLEPIVCEKDGGVV